MFVFQNPFEFHFHCNYINTHFYVFRVRKMRENTIFRVFLIHLLNKLRVLIFASFSLDLEFFLKI